MIITATFTNKAEAETLYNSKDNAVITFSRSQGWVVSYEEQDADTILSQAKNQCEEHKNEKGVVHGKRLNSIEYKARDALVTIGYERSTAWKMAKQVTDQYGKYTSKLTK